MKFISPIEAKQQAEQLMLDGREATTNRDWQQIINCWAANFPLDLVEVETKVVAKIMNCPLDDETIEAIVAYQKALRP